MTEGQTKSEKNKKSNVNIAMNDKSLPSKRRKINIKCENLYRIFKQGDLEVVALNSVDMNIYEGEIVVIMGPSGSGKTTLLNVISGLDRATAGHIHIRGFDVTRMRDEGIQQILQNEIGIVFQFFNLIPSLTAEGNIELPMTIAKKSASFKKIRVAELLKEIDMVNRANHRPFTLSGGEKQRVAIAMAFANNPNIILADEPTGNIDSISADKVMEIFKKFIEHYPEKSIVIVTHDPTLRRIADRTLLIKDGKIIRELGRIKDDSIEIEDQSDEGFKEMNRIYQLKNAKDKVKEILNPVTRFIDYKDLNHCPACNSDKIIKNFDQDDPIYKMKNNQLITRVVIFCEDCHQMYFNWASLLDIKQNI